MAVPVRADLIATVADLAARGRGAVGRRIDRDRSDLRALGRALPSADALLAGPDAPDQGLWQEQMLGRSAGTVGGGTSEVHRNGLEERALGLPREARPDRHEAFKDLKTSGS